MTKPSSGSVLGDNSSANVAILTSLTLLLLSILFTGCGGANVGPNNGSSLSITPNAIDFGTFLSGQNGATRTIAVTNVGLSKVTVEQVSVSPSSVFRIQDWGGPVTLASGQSFNLRLAFAPAIPGNYAGLLTFLSSAARPIAPMTVSVSSSSSGFAYGLKSSTPNAPLHSI